MLRRAAAAIIALAASAVLAADPAPRGRLPLVVFTAAQGLPSDIVLSLLIDSRGFLWIGTTDGLARYDGAHFVTYPATTEGLPYRSIHSLAEDRDGNIWVGTVKGAARLDPRSPAKFIPVPGPFPAPMPAYRQFAGRDGTLWSMCNDDLCTARDGRLVPDLGYRAASKGVAGVFSVADGKQPGELWVGSVQGLMHRTPDGKWQHYALHPHQGEDHVDGLLTDADGRVWATDAFGTVVFSTPPDPADPRSLWDRAKETITPGQPFHYPTPGEVVRYTIPRPQPAIGFGSPVLVADGTYWQYTALGLLHIGSTLELLDERNDLPQLGTTAVAEDAAGNLWVGTYGGGLVRIARDGFTTYTQRHGLSDDRITSIFELDDGSLCVTNAKGLSCFQEGVVHNTPIHPQSIKYGGWGWNQVMVHDRSGEWWVASGEGLVRWPPVKRIEDLAKQTPIAVYKIADGLGGDDIFRLWQDSRGDLWMGTFGKQALSRRDHVTGKITSYGPAEGYTATAPSAFAEDRAGNVWIGAYEGGLIRTAGGGKFESFHKGMPEGFVRDLKVDSHGALWAATVGGVVRIDNPTSAAADIRLTKIDATVPSYCLAETTDGRMAIGSVRGLDLLHPTGGVAHLSTDDGLAANAVSVAMRDRAGTLWLGTLRGLSALRVPPEIRPIPPPRPRVVRLEVSGVPSPLPELGTAELSGLRVRYPQRALTIAFAAPSFDFAHRLRYEYRFAADDRWTPAEGRGAVTYERLPYGSGTFEVRSIATDGTRSAPAHVSFDVVPPVWLRPWFVVLMALAAVATAYALHRLRVEHLLALQRVRQRMATDLHDDLGSSLSRISILTEVAKSSEDDRVLSEIGDTARGMVEALSDSIWSIDPRRDDVQSLLSRARHFAADMLDAKSIALDVVVTPEAAACRIDPQRRRDLYLILKEALNNAAKHAGARRVVVTAAQEGRTLRVDVADDGKGFSPAETCEREDGGRGMASMHERARRAGGELSIASEAGRGTRLSVAVPV